MKNKKPLILLPLTIAIFFLLHSLSFALSNNVILYDQTSLESNPFEMNSFSLAYGKSDFYGYQPNNKKNTSDYYEFKLETPLYKKYLDLGFQYSFITKNIIGSEYSFFLKLKAPFHFFGGDIALTNSYRLGLINAFYQKEKNVDYSRSLGGMGAIGVGIEYFPIRWVGIFAEQSVRHYNFLLNKRLREVTNEGANNHPLSLNTYVFVFGIKFTF